MLVNVMCVSACRKHLCTASRAVHATLVAIMVWVGFRGTALIPMWEHVLPGSLMCKHQPRQTKVMIRFPKILIKSKQMLSHVLISSPVQGLLIKDV